MTKVAILPVPSESGDVSFCAVAGDKHSQGKTAGEALDALTPQLSVADSGTLIIVQNLSPDHFFTAEQQRRLGDLMAHWRDARDRGKALPETEQSELEALVEAELRASTARASDLADQLDQ